MGRPKSIDRRIQGKTLAEVRQELRQIEKTIVAESVRSAGEMAVDIFRENPNHQVFLDYADFRQKVEELSVVLATGKRTPPSRKTQNREPVKNPVNLPERSDFAEQKKQEIKPARFVKDIADQDL